MAASAPAPIPPGLERRCASHGLYVAHVCPDCLAERLDRERRARSVAVLVLAVALLIGLVVLLGGWPPG